MNIIFNAKFFKELKKISDKKVLKKVELLILEIEKTESIQQLSNVKQLKGVRNAYRFKLDSYRIGFFLNDDSLEIITIKHRKEIYRFFP
ncbi:MAG: type II toxin-antitoxin system RelE family toxin [Flavobacteriia bacterium]|jgi:mRNA interferase RelE/StbE